MERGYLLHAIAAAIGGRLRAGSGDRRIVHLSIDTRRPAAEHTLFIALRGAHHDGHAYIAQAARNGMHDVLAEAGAAFDDRGLNVVEVPDTLAALQRLAAWHRAHFRVPVIGITGSNGKTVVKEWAFQALGEEEHIARSPGSWNSQVGVPLSVWELGPEHTLGLFEAGISRPGEMARLAPIIAPTIGLFTNLGPAHAEQFASDREKAREKALLFAQAEAVVHCSDHVLVHEALAELDGPLLRGWSRTREAFVRVRSEEAIGPVARLVLEHAGTEFPLELPFNDAASIENALHVATLLLHLGRTPAQVAERLHRLAPVAMRLEVVAGVDDGTLINDAYSNDLGSFRIALDHLARMADGRPRTVVLSDIAESKEAPAKLYGQVADLLRQARVDRLIGIGPTIAAHRSLFPAEARFFPDAEALLQAFPAPPIEGAVTLLKGARRFGLERVVERWQQHTHGTVMEVDLDALRHNLNHYRERCGPQVRVMAMVKAGGYGTSATELARLFAHEQVAYLGVAYVDEGIALRQNGIRTPVLVMNPEPVPLEVLHRFGLEAEVYDRRSLQAAIDLARHVPDAPPVHIKLDTGMHRLGFMAAEVPALLDALRQAPFLRVASVLSHLAASEDPREDAFTRGQIERFRALAGGIDAVLGYHPLWHIANSAAASRFPEARLDLVRLGIGLHGIGADAGETALLRPAAALRTVIAQIKDIPAGDTVSYGRLFTAARDMRIAVLPIGYADGLARRLGHGKGRVWINGRPAPFVGTICMDMCMVDVTDIACALDDVAVVFSAEHPLQDLARDLGTIPYEVLTSISPRVKRVLVHA
ncbi:MAG: bifunctional UDP-N-acetylmuramoyl-tripeptide:D-alanyl-D-alanine ligase/alanine racemase [Bacteroidetes bacterium]|nr:bifunctional UDP-N-acetylmuramoyl-tripeptide:D-alanyl-D-alanine ligase/alanine racemase [Bacteroidota bacterium]